MIDESLEGRLYVIIILALFLIEVAGSGPWQRGSSSPLCGWKSKINEIEIK